ncbi:MAG: ribonuclease M5 [Erysipelotrichaceae bacterium]|nr:ribonuclease M5 [Erysipelotrichaceae bacterium]
MKIKEVIVVEGKNDTLNLKRYFDCDTIETHGTCLSDFTIKLIKKINEKRGVIILSDPDSPGDYIRTMLNKKIPNLKHAFLNKEDARSEKKVGVEHAGYEALKKALDNVISYGDCVGNIGINDMVRFGLTGSENSKDKRYELAKFFNLGKANTKTLIKRMNMMGLNVSDIEEVILNDSKHK